MKTSSRNVYPGKITALVSGDICDEVEIQLETGEKIYGQITRHSSRRLGLEVGKDAVAIVKAAEVMLVDGSDDYILSCRNQFQGRVIKLTCGFVNGEVLVHAPSGFEINATITLDGVIRLKLERGSTVVAMFKTSNVVIAVKK